MKKNKQHLKGYTLYLIVLVIGLILFRLFLTADIPLLDKTESRYAEISRLMYETGNWVVLQIDQGVPFWAKPPLSTWLSAASFKIFGVNEFAARLPSFLLNISLIFIICKFLIKDMRSWFIVGFILLTMPEFLLHTGVVSTDTSLCFSITLIMISFWKAMNDDQNRYWKYLFFVGVALGFLSKGPLVLVLTGPPILAWLIVQKVKIKSLFKKLPWILGILITALIAVPWYILAEMRSPGFIDYFIVGEHFNRFLESKWQGDLYGGPKSEMLGTIWVFLLVFTFPWIQIVLFKLWKTRKSILSNSYLSYLVFWMLWTPVFFTISKNILHTYILPATIPLALIVMYFWKDYTKKKLAVVLASIFPIAIFIFFFGLRFTDHWKHNLNTNKYLIQNLDNPSPSIYFWEQTDFSGEFYTKGQAKLIKDVDQLENLIIKDTNSFIIITNKKWKRIPDETKTRMKLQDSIYKTSIYRLEKNGLIP